MSYTPGQHYYAYPLETLDDAVRQVEGHLAPVEEPDAATCDCAIVMVYGRPLERWCAYASRTVDAAHIRRALRFQASFYKRPGDDYESRTCREAARKKVGT